MTDKVVDKTDEAVVEVQPAETVEELKTQLAEASAEATKQRKIAKDAIAKRDAVKKTGSEDGNDYKKLFGQSEERTTKLVDKMKRADITAAATAQLSKIGVTADGMTAAVKLLDMAGIEWDEEDGVDSTSLKGAVTTLRNEYPFLFDKKVASTTVKTAKDGSSTVGDGTITRTAFEALDGVGKNSVILKKIKIISG